MPVSKRMCSLVRHEYVLVQELVMGWADIITYNEKNCLMSHVPVTVLACTNYRVNVNQGTQKKERKKNGVKWN